MQTKLIGQGRLMQVIDPLGQPTIPAYSDHYFCTCFRPYVRPHFSKYLKNNIV